MKRYLVIGFLAGWLWLGALRRLVGLSRPPHCPYCGWTDGLEVFDICGGCNRWVG